MLLSNVISHFPEWFLGLCRHDLTSHLTVFKMLLKHCKCKIESNGHFHVPPLSQKQGYEGCWKNMKPNHLYFFSLHDNAFYMRYENEKVLTFENVNQLRTTSTNQFSIFSLHENAFAITGYFWSLFSVPSSPLLCICDQYIVEEDGVHMWWRWWWAATCIWMPALANPPLLTRLSRGDFIGVLNSSEKKHVKRKMKTSC